MTEGRDGAGPGDAENADAWPVGGAGALAQQIVSTGGEDIDGALKVGFRCVVIVGFVIVAQLALDALRTGAARTSTGVRPTV